MYCKAIANVDLCLSFFENKRMLVNLTTNQYKFLNDTQRLFMSAKGELSPLVLPPNECIMLSIVLTGVPLFNRMKNGCTPFVEVYTQDKKIFTNIQDYDSLK